MSKKQAKEKRAPCTKMAAKPLRAHRGSMSMRELAKRAGVSEPCISLIEIGLRDPSLHMLKKLAKVLKVKPWQLIW